MAVSPAVVRCDGLVMAAFIIVAFGGTADAGEGALMIAALAGCIALSLWQGAGADSVPQRHREEAESTSGLPTRLQLMLGCVAGGLLSVTAGAGVADEVIGLTLVAVGTSLPEIATAVVAAWRRQAAIRVGNVMGSNIFNLFGIRGARGARALLHENRRLRPPGARRDDACPGGAAARRLVPAAPGRTAVGDPLLCVHRLPVPRMEWPHDAGLMEAGSAALQLA